jgi:pyruvate dehydrogenase E2 component (dihydrolipoamide acetyltransferase)
LEVETDKIASAVEASDAGKLRRVLGEVDAVYPVKALIGLLADDDLSDEEIEAYVASYAAAEARNRFVHATFARRKTTGEMR